MWASSWSTWAWKDGWCVAKAEILCPLSHTHPDMIRTFFTSHKICSSISSNHLVPPDVSQATFCGLLPTDDHHTERQQNNDQTRIIVVLRSLINNLQLLIWYLMAKCKTGKGAMLKIGSWSREPHKHYTTFNSMIRLVPSVQMFHYCESCIQTGDDRDRAGADSQHIRPSVTSDPSACSDLQRPSRKNTKKLELILLLHAWRYGSFKRGQRCHYLHYFPSSPYSALPAVFKLFPGVCLAK